MITLLGLIIIVIKWVNNNERMHMFTEQDQGKGLVKVQWSDVRERVAKVEPAFASIVDELGPDKSLPIYLGYYPYGMLIGDTISQFIPKLEGGIYRLSDPNIPKDLIKHLGYGIDSAPLGMVLEKEMEYFLDLKDTGVTIPWLIYRPGSFFAVSRVLNKKQNRIYAPNGVLSAASGARSIFMLPHIGCATNHSNLQRDYNVQSHSPKSMYEHWSIFKEIINSEVTECNWRSCVMYFSEKWIDKLHNDKSWLRLKMYLHELAWHKFEYDRNRIYYDIVFSVIQQKKNLKPNPYLADTARHLFTTALGAAPGYIPASNDEACPWEIIQTAFTQSYGLKKYHPTIMQPAHFKFEEDKLPIYYSLQHPSTQAFSPKSRKASSTLFEMRELSHIMRVFIKELSNDNAMCSSTIMSKIAQQVEFKFFHNEVDRHQSVTSSMNMPILDKRFKLVSSKNKVAGSKFSADAKFVRGCISIVTKR